MKQYLLIPLTVILTSCGWLPDGHYSVLISPDFTPEQVQQVKDCLKIWAEKTSDWVEFEIVSEPREEDLIQISPTTSQRLTNAKSNKNNYTVTGYITYQGSSSHIEISVDLTAAEFQETVLHEVGHALNLEHDLPGTIMAPDGYGISTVTCQDLKQFCNVWECDYKEMKGCQE